MSRIDLTETAKGDRAPQRLRRSKRIWGSVAVAIVLLVVGVIGGPYIGKLGSVQKNDNSAYLPKSAESTRVDKESERFNSLQTIPGFIVYQRDTGLTAADKTKIAADAQAIRGIAGVASDQVAVPRFAADGKTANISVPLIGKNGNVSVNGDDLVNVEKNVIAVARNGAPPGLAVHSAGAGGLLVAFIDAFKGIDGTLLMAAIIVVIAILLIVYRSPMLWIFPLVSAVFALGAAALIVYPLAKHNVLTLNGQTQGILFVLVLGAGTDYALLLISRYREELHSYDSRAQAMAAAWRGAAPAIAASATTVILGLLCLTLGELNSDRSLGPVAAIGIACTVVVMLGFLPVFLAIFGRWVFWPRVPHVDHQADIATHGMWGKFAATLGRNARRMWISTAVVLVACVVAVTGLRTAGLGVTDSFTNTPDAVTGQKIFDATFNQGAGAPAVIVANADQTQAVIDAAKQVPGVDRGADAVCVEPDYAKIAQLAKAGTLPAGLSTNVCAPPQLALQPRNGRILIDANIVYRFDTPQAYQTVNLIRAAVRQVPGANALVGGASARNYDTNQASRHDRNLIIPIVLLVILIVLALLLRALLVPLLLIATVVLSFTATLGVCALVFNHVFHFKNADPAFPLFAFIFLVALGIDYNIFLMTRVREETLEFGTRSGILRGLAVTGGVITSAGVVLAATFAVLGVLPVVFLAEIGFAVAFGVLLDTILVRSILVPALSHDIGKPIWWPSRLARGAN
jgi:putative drug exporter of the RND superfamily